MLKTELRKDIRERKRQFTSQKLGELSLMLMNKLLENNIGGTSAIKLVDLLFDRPVISSTSVAEEPIYTWETKQKRRANEKNGAFLS
jgi:hypothetical protein